MKIEDVMDGFVKSKKRHIFITGSKSMGKSTLCKELSEYLHANSMITKAVYQDNITPDYIEVQVDHKKVVFADYNRRDNKFIVYPEKFKEVALTFLEHNNSKWISIDEIGYLEKDIQEYNDLLRQTLLHNHLLLTLRKDKETELLEYLRSYEDAYFIDLDEQTFDVSCIIMASGIGTRFGSNKLLADFQGKTLLEQVLDQIPFELFKEVILVTRYPQVVEQAKSYGITCILHDLPRQSDTIKIGMEHITKTKGCMFVTCDQPLRTTESIRKLLLTFWHNQEAMVRLCFKELIGNPVIFPSIYYEELKNLSQGEKGSTVVKAHPGNMIYVEANHRYELADVDTKEDLLHLLKISD